MKSQTKSKKLTVLSLILLILVSAIFGLQTFPQKVTASGSNTINKLKFRQIETGLDFAIGLTYNGDLYGWSLTRTDEAGNFDTNAQSLGGYYPKYPRKINVTFYEDIVDNAGTQSNPYVIAGRLSTKSDETISKIATTKTTAALITSTGYIYTWGYDEQVVLSFDPTSTPSAIISKSGLLFRNETNNNDPVKSGEQFYVYGINQDQIRVYLPQPIMHHGYSLVNEKINRSFSEEGKPNATDVFGSDNNYIIQVGTNQFFAWGNSSFGQLRPDDTNEDTNSNFQRPEQTLTTFKNYSQIIPGSDYFIGNKNGDWHLKGKNYYLPDQVSATSSSVSVPNVFDITTTNRLGYIVADTGVGGLDGYEIPNAVAVSFKKINNLSILPSNTNTSFKNSDGKDSGLVINDGLTKSIALGTGFMYYINSNNEVFLKGSNYQGQNGTGTNGGSNTNGTQIPGITNATQVVAGKIPASPTYVAAGGVNNLALRAQKYFKNGMGDTGLVIDDNATAVISYNETNYDVDERFSDLAKDTYISAAITANGRVSAWGYYVDKTQNPAIGTPVVASQVLFEKPTVIVKLTSGYGNNLFALDEYGKIYHIKYVYNTTASAYEYKGVPVNKFLKPDDGTTIEPWSIGTSDEKPTATIKSGYNDKNGGFQIRPTIGNEAHTSSAAATKPLGDLLETTGKIISSDFSGDVFRIMYNETPANQPDVAGIVLNDTIPDSNDGVMFYLGNEKMTYRAVSKYIDWSLKYNSANKDLYFEIIPKRSTMGRTLTMKFYVGRFDTINNFENATFYDAKQISYDIIIENTEIETGLASSNIKLGNYLGEGKNASIPLLDPNNPYNSTYSIAVMNVSAGFDEIIREISIYSQKQSELKTKILEQMSKDDGFPAVSKVDDGKLSHTLGADVDIYYEGRYQYIAEDIDGSLLKVSSISQTRKASNVYSRKIDIVLNLTDILSHNEDFKQFIIPGTGANKDFLQGFDNKYGFYDLTLEETATSYILKFSYDVIVIEATGSTNSVSYKDGKIAGAVFNSTIPEDKYDNFTVTIYEDGNNTKTAMLSKMPVHAQSALRLKDNDYLQTSDVERVYGGDDGSGSNHINAVIPSMTIGTGPRTINIDEFFDDTTNIFFAYEMKRGDASYDKFEGTFNKLIFEMSITGTSFTFMPKSAGKGQGETFEFVIEVRRFAVVGYELSDDVTFKDGTKDTEVIYIHFSVTCTSSPFGHRDATAPTSYTLTSIDVVDIGKRLNTSALEYVEIIGYELSDAQSGNKIVSVKHIGGLKLEFVPIRSGLVQVRYFLRRFNELLEGSFDIIVESIAQVGSYEIATSHSFQINDIKNSLKAENSASNFRDEEFDELIINTDDEVNAPKGFYFQIYEQTSTGLSEWKFISTTDERFPQWIDLKNSGLRGTGESQYLRIELGNISSSSQAQIIRVVLKFKNNDSSRKFEAAIEITPAHKIIQDKTTGDFLLVDIVFGVPFEGQEHDTANKLPKYNDDKEKSVSIPLKHFVSNLLGETIDEKGQYQKVTLNFIRPEDGYQKYFKVSRENPKSEESAAIRITPLYPTKELASDRVQVSMSVSNRNPDNTVSNYMFTFYVRVSGISIDLNKAEYTKLFIITMAALLVLMFLVFIIRMSVYWKRKAKQRSIIRKNQTLIKLRDKMHQKNSTVSKERMVRTKMKMDDPKYAKMFNEMREKKEEETGISLDNSAIAQKADKKLKASKSKNKKDGKKSIDELRAELEAKKMAFAQMQGGVPPVMNMDSTMGGIEMDQSIIDSNPVFDNEYHGDLSREDVESQIKAKIAEEDFLEFETIEPDENSII